MGNMIRLKNKIPTEGKRIGVSLVCEGKTVEEGIL